MRRVQISTGVGLILLALSGIAAVGDGDAPAAPRPPASVPAAADEAVRLAAAPDDAGLARLAAASPFDPWLVADELCARGAFDAADAFARAAPATRRGGLPAFIAGQRRAPSDPGRRAAHRQAAAARSAGRPAEGLRIVDAAGEPRDDVVSVRLLHERVLDMGELGNRRGAIDALLALVDRVRAMDWPTREADLVMHAASLAQEIGDFELSARLWGRVAAIQRKFPAPAEEGVALHQVARMHFLAGRLGEALQTMRRALPLVAQGGDGIALGRSLSALAVYEEAAGDLAPAKAHHEDALRLLGASADAEDRVRATMNASRTCFLMNDLPGAIALADRALADPALAVATKPGKRPDPSLISIRGRMLLNRAEYRLRSGDLDGADADLEIAARAFSEVGAAAWSVRIAGLRGDLALERGDFERAATMYREALATAEALDDPTLLARSRMHLGDVDAARGSLADGSPRWTAALADARAAGDAGVASDCLRRLAEASLAGGDARGALDRAREAVALESRRTHRLGADESATLAAGGASCVEVGLVAARRTGDLVAWIEMAEFGRASALAESVGGRAAIQTAAVSDALAAESDAAAAELARATDELAKARAAGDLAASRAAATAERAARERVRVVQDRIERWKKLAAKLDAPTPPALDEIRGRVGKTRALVVFHFGLETSDALVVAADGARLVDLGATAALVAKCEAARASDASADAVAAAKAALVDALALPKEIATLLVVPDGPVATLPFALLAPDRDVAMVPSALVWTLLDAERGVRGTGVLAVGDPDYAGTKLVPLPATRAEAEAVGTRTVLGKDATEDALRRALVESPRWRAVHFACHGVVDARHPSLSGLALTRAAPDDGVFTAREVLGLPVPADVVVLAACEAGRAGAQSAATGVPPAFLAAGAPRVVANLWKVDDEAGRVFSVAFHRAWAKEGASAASALRAARDAVRADPRFTAPRFWAGWILWGLAD